MTKKAEKEYCVELEFDSHISGLETITAPEGYTAKDYIRDFADNEPEDLIGIIEEGPYGVRLTDDDGNETECSFKDVFAAVKYTYVVEDHDMFLGRKPLEGETEDEVMYDGYEFQDWLNENIDGAIYEDEDGETVQTYNVEIRQTSPDEFEVVDRDNDDAFIEAYLIRKVEFVNE